MPSRPLILVPARPLPAGAAGRVPVVSVGASYLQALWRAGAQEMIVSPRAPDDGDDGNASGPAGLLLGRADGLLLLGGPDVTPALYGQQARPEVYGTNEVADRFEIALVQAAVGIGLPTLGICRGLQVINVALGGTLHQHLGDQPGVSPRTPPGFPTPSPGTTGPLLPVSVSPGTRLADALGSTSVIGAHSHHQGLDRLGTGLHQNAVAADGVMEGAEHETGWMLGVQWHPEDTATTDPVQQRLFDSFAVQARAKMRPGSQSRRADGPQRVST